MIKTLSLYDFRNEWANSSRKNSFSYEGLELLYDHLEENDPQYDLDIVELDSLFTEATPEEIEQDYDIDGLEDAADDEEREQIIMDFLENETTVLGKTDKGTIVFNSNF